MCDFTKAGALVIWYFMHTGGRKKKRTGEFDLSGQSCNKKAGEPGEWKILVTIPLLTG